ncbi:MAG: Yip1 family protein [Methanoregula sp.]|nr:Yip1 family protein [Methanoregula sp.]
MKKCPDCGREISLSDSESTSFKKVEKTPFTIRQFLWDNFRFFTMIGITGTMISLIPNMGTRILGATWITDTETFLPLFLSIIIFFGAIFLTLCFLIIFSLIIQARDSEKIWKKITLHNKTLIIWYEGDFQRTILLFCLVPMWVGLLLFFIMLMPLIPNKYSWLFATIIGLTCIPLFIYSCLGWNMGKKVTGLIPGMRKFPLISVVVFTILVVGFFLILPFAIPQFFNNTDTFSGDIKIRPDHLYFSPHLSSVKGLRLEITNLSGRELQASRHIWSANFGYFIRVIPSTSEVIILGNPVDNRNSRDIYWTYSQNNPEQVKKPVKINLHLYPLQGNEEISNSSLYLTWYDNDIVYANTSCETYQ